MTATPYTGTQLAGWFLDTFAKDVGKLTPEEALLYRMTPYDPDGRKPGELWSKTLIVQSDHGVTELYGASAMTLFALNEARAAKFEEAQVLPSAFMGRLQIPYMVAARAQKGTASHGTVKELIAEGAEELVSRIEIAFVHGGRDLGVIESVGTASSEVLPDVKITQATFSAGLLSRMDNGQFDVYDTTLATKRNTNPLVLSALDIENRDFTLTGEVAGDVSSIVATDKIFLLNTKGNQFDGLINQIDLQTGTVYNINKAAYSAYRGNCFDVAGPLSMETVLRAAGKARPRGLRGECVLLCDPEIWEQLNEQVSALRSYDTSYGSQKALNGVEAIEYHYQAGKIYLVSHAFMKQGEAVLYPKKKVQRIGCSEPTTEVPGRGKMITDIANSAGFEARLFADQVVFLEQVAASTYLYGITT